MKIANMVPRHGMVIVRRIRAEESTEGGLAIASNDDEFIAYGEVIATASEMFEIHSSIFFHILDGNSFKATDVSDALQDYFLISEEKILGNYLL